SGFYYDTIPNAVGCDSLMTLNLTITQDSYHELFENACTSYTSSSGLYTWTEDGTYMDTIPNSAGCDSILTIHLAFHSTYAEWNVEECTSYTSPSGNYTWTANGIYQDIIPNAMGCDSILTIVLQLLSTTSMQNVVECFSYTSPSGLYTWTNSGLHQDVIPNSVGCDSIMNINLVILNVNTNVNVNGNTLSSAATGATYLWLDCNNDYEAIAGATTQIFAPTQNGNYAAMVTQQNCTDTTACYAITGIGIDELVMSDWKLFPNPTSGIIQLTSEHGTTGTQAILMDVQGRKVDEHYITSLPFVWNMQQPSGIYYLHLISEKDASVLKVLVE
ncbi:MAG: T9SS type A sorting domain-containing protein, partial [Flavobacteriales bacterium]